MSLEMIILEEVHEVLLMFSFHR